MRRRRIVCHYDFSRRSEHSVRSRLRLLERWCNPPPTHDQLMGELTHIATALIDALPDSALDKLAVRIASRKVRPALLDRKTAAQYLGVSTEWLRRNVQHVCLPGCEKPLYPVAQLDALVRSADRRKTSGA